MNMLSVVYKSCRRLEIYKTRQNVKIILIKPLKPKHVEIIFNNSVRTAKKTQHFAITKINWLMLFKEIIAIYSDNHMEPINTISVENVELLVVKAGGTYSYR
jgi:hypothetical protein